jgi:hypothetical protein
MKIKQKNIKWLEDRWVLLPDGNDTVDVSKDDNILGANKNAIKIPVSKPICLLCDKEIKGKGVLFDYRYNICEKCAERIKENK